MLLYILLLLSFYFFEECGLLHIENELDIYALQFIFLEIIQEKLDYFKIGWSHHSLRTGRKLTYIRDA